MWVRKYWLMSLGCTWVWGTEDRSASLLWWTRAIGWGCYFADSRHSTRCTPVAEGGLIDVYLVLCDVNDPAVTFITCKHRL